MKYENEIIQFASQRFAEQDAKSRNSSASASFSGIASCFTFRQIVIGTCLFQIFAGAVHFLFTFYGYKLLIEVDNELRHSNLADRTIRTDTDITNFSSFSAFSNADETLNLLIAVSSVLIAFMGFAGSISYHFNTVYFVLSGLAAGAALFAACCSVFATLVTILIGLPNTVFGKVMSSFTSNFAFQPISQHHVTSGINLVEAIVCIIAANSVGIIMNFALASSFAISSAASFKLRELQVQTRRKRKQTYSDYETEEADYIPHHGLRTA